MFETTITNCTILDVFCVSFMPTNNISYFNQWLVLEARKLASTIRGVCQNNYTAEEEELLISLDSFGYTEAAETVYGCKYEEWKEAHQRKANEEQM